MHLQNNTVSSNEKEGFKAGHKRQSVSGCWPEIRGGECLRSVWIGRLFLLLQMSPQAGCVMKRVRGKTPKALRSFARCVVSSAWLRKSYRRYEMEVNSQEEEDTALVMSDSVLDNRGNSRRIICTVTSAYSGLSAAIQILENHLKMDRWTGYITRSEYLSTWHQPHGCWPDRSIATIFDPERLPTNGSLAGLLGIGSWRTGAGQLGR